MSDRPTPRYLTHPAPDHSGEWLVATNLGNRVARCPDRWTASMIARLLETAASLDAEIDVQQPAAQRQQWPEGTPAWRQWPEGSS